MHKTVALTFAGLSLAATLLLGATAQSTSGNIVGEASVGDTIIVSNTDIGFSREIKIEKDGKFQVRRVPIGVYQVVHVLKDGRISPAQIVSVRPDASARVANVEPTETQPSENTR